MADRKLTLTILGDSKGAEQALGAVEEKAGGLGAALGKAGTIAAGFITANVISGGVGKLTDAIGDSIAGFREQAEVSAQTEAVIKSTGGAAGMSAKEIESLAGALKGQSKFADDAIQSGENLLLTFTGIGKDVFPDATQAMLDMAQATGKDLPSSAVMLGKALNDPAKGIAALTKNGVVFTDAQEKQIKTMTAAGDVAGAQRVILAELSKEFGGSAKAASDAAGGAEKYADKMDDLKDAIGEKLLPVQEKWMAAKLALITFLATKGLPILEALGGMLGDKIAPAIEVVSGLFGRAKEFLGNFIGDVAWLIENGSSFQETISPGIWADVAHAIARLVEIVRDDLIPLIRDKIVPAMLEFSRAVGEKVMPVITALIDYLGSHKEILAAAAIVIAGVLVGAFLAWAVAAGAAAVATIAAALPVIALGLVLTALVTGIILLVKHWDELIAKYPVLGQATDAIKSAFSAFVGWITGTFVPAVMNIATTIAAAVTAAVAFVVEHWDEIRAFIQPALDALALIIEAVWAHIRNVIETAIGVIKGVVDVFMGVFTGDWDRAWNGVKQIVSSVWGGIKEEIAIAIELIKGLVPLMLSAAGALGNALKDGFIAGVRGTIGVIGDLGEGLMRALKDLINTAIDAVNDAIPNSMSLSILGKSVGVDLPDNPIPHLAKGGIVKASRGGTLAVIGEGGRDEAVIPLDGRRGMGGVTINLNVAGAYVGERQIEDVLVSALVRARARGAAV